MFTIYIVIGIVAPKGATEREKPEGRGPPREERRGERGENEGGVRARGRRR